MHTEIRTQYVCLTFILQMCNLNRLQKLWQSYDCSPGNVIVPKSVCNLLSVISRSVYRHVICIKYHEWLCLYYLIGRIGCLIRTIHHEKFPQGSKLSEQMEESFCNIKRLKCCSALHLFRTLIATCLLFAPQILHSFIPGYAARSSCCQLLCHVSINDMGFSQNS